jgi:hypothetical protein
MRASLHIKLPNLCSDGTDTKAKAICKPLGLSVRGLGGEHTPIGADGTVDISPSARFCITEAEIITALYKGIEQLKAAEDAAPAGDPSEKIAALLAGNPDNICLNTWDPAYFASLSDELKPAFLKCLNSGTLRVPSLCCCRAPAAHRGADLTVAAAHQASRTRTVVWESTPASLTTMTASSPSSRRRWQNTTR